MGDVLEQLHREGHISDKLYVVAARLLEDMRRAHGTSGGIVTLELSERVQSSTRPRWRPPGGGDPDAFSRMDSVLGRLHAHERETMAYMIKARELPRGRLADRGRQVSGFEHSRSASAYMTGRICSLLESIAELYPVPLTR